MSTPFQNRLVGTIIVAAAAVIFLPDFLDGEKKEFHQKFDDIPKPPSFDNNETLKSFPNSAEQLIKSELPNEEPTSDEVFERSQKQVAETVELASDNSQIENIQENNEVDQQDSALASLPTTSASDAKAWVIQLGSFRNKQNVNSLTSLLKTNGFTVYTKPVSTNAGELTQVFIGPEIDQNGLEKKIDTIFQLTKVKGKVVPFTVN